MFAGYFTFLDYKVRDNVEVSSSMCFLSGVLRTIGTYVTEYLDAYLLFDL